MKKYLIIILTLLILTEPGLSLAQEVEADPESEVEYTVHDGPSDIEEEVANEGEYIYIETRDHLEPGLFENIIKEKEENEKQLPGFLNYKSWQFWFLLIILLAIVFVLIRLLKKISKINMEIKRHENYLKEVKVKKHPQVSEEDEIIYTEPQDQ